MKNILIPLLTFFLLFVSCKRDEVVEPPISGPSTLSYIIEGKASPSTLLVGSTPNTVQIRVRLYDFSGRPIVGAPIYFETVWKFILLKRTYDQYENLTSEEEEEGSGTADLGNFYGNFKYIAYTDAEGYIHITYTGPDLYEYCRKTFSYFVPSDNLSKEEYYYYITSFYVLAKWASPPSPNMSVYSYIPISLKTDFSWPSLCKSLY